MRHPYDHGLWLGGVADAAQNPNLGFVLQDTVALIEQLPSEERTVLLHDRRASRDLCDLRALNQVGAIDGAAADLYRRYGPTNRLPGTHLFENPPADRDRQSQRAAQTRLIVTAATALAEVRDAWARTADTP